MKIIYQNFELDFDVDVAEKKDEKLLKINTNKSGIKIENLKIEVLNCKMKSLKKLKLEMFLNKNFQRVFKTSREETLRDILSCFNFKEDFSSMKI